jgi:hypothetical protein
MSFEELLRLIKRLHIVARDRVLDGKPVTILEDS